jgi:hypothetical protein
LETVSPELLELQAAKENLAQLYKHPDLGDGRSDSAAYVLRGMEFDLYLPLRDFISRKYAIQ